MRSAIDLTWCLRCAVGVAAAGHVLSLQVNKQQPEQPQETQQASQQAERSNNAAAPKYKGQDVVSLEGSVWVLCCGQGVQTALLLGPQALPHEQDCPVVHCYMYAATCTLHQICSGADTLMLLRVLLQRRQANGADSPGGAPHWSRNSKQQGWGGEPLANSSSAPEGALVSGMAQAAACMCLGPCGCAGQGMFADIWRVPRR